jgi:hypothetical protein
MSCKLGYQLRYRSDFQGILGLLNNPWFYGKLWSRFIRYLYPAHYPVVEMTKPVLDANLVSLDGETNYSLVKDFVDTCPPNMPLIINIGSFN